jgi:hypothetical protein
MNVGSQTGTSTALPAANDAMDMTTNSLPASQRETDNPAVEPQ